MSSALQFIESSPTESLLAAFAAGIILHVGAFRHGEWDLHTTKILIAFLAINGALAGGLIHYADYARGQAFKVASSIVGSTLAGTYTSILIYRGLFHRLRRFPGPFAAKLSNFYVTSLSIKKFHLYEEVQELHEKYGDYVRVGPSTLSVADPEAFNLIHSNNSPCGKGPWYNIMHPVISLHMIRDRKEHAVRRKTWDKGFSSKALRDYEPRVARYTDLLISRIEESSGKVFDASKWFNFYSFDVMGDLAFGKSFNMLKEGVVHYYMKSVHTNMLLVSAFSHLVWMFPLFKETPGLNGEHIKFQKWLSAQVVERQKNKPDLPDVFSWILDDYDAIERPTKQDTTNLHGDAHLIVVAGSDTTAASLTCLFFELANNPETCKLLQQEIDAFYAENEGPSHQALSKLKYLQACIDESLRLHPPVPSGLQRMTPPEGLQVGDKFIPGNTILQMPTYTINRDKRAFERPNEFIPERWTAQKELTKDASIFAPFSVGRFSCVGRQLGLMEVRFVTAEILRRYDVRLATKDTANQFLSGLKDGFTLAAPNLQVVFTPRKTG
ncbi:hypothetical protein NM208_g5743 [Fusarium decemcellulare]|uniref:Uncharacterized protein n=1 Tax=Fusarium decemcellulare TaxID=57161 RepID=A0ACC1SFV6_9HYPO|nr:hypothetical protein NM208_g5743 [Fusarium decemcellulare]